MKMLPTAVLITLFIGKSCCFLIYERNGTAILTDTDQNDRYLEKEHDGELVVHLRKNGNYDAAPIFPKIDKIHRVVKRAGTIRNSYIKKVTPKYTTASMYTDVTFECELYAELVKQQVEVLWYYHNSSSKKKITEENFEEYAVQKQMGFTELPFSNKTSEISLLREAIKYNGNPQKLHLRNVTQLDEGWYTCVAHKAFYTYTDNAYLKVNNEKSIITWENIDIELICTVVAILIVIFIILYCFIDIKFIYKLIIK